MASSTTYSIRNDNKDYVVVFYPFDYFKSKRRRIRRVWKNQIFSDQVNWKDSNSSTAGLVAPYIFQETSEGRQIRSKNSTSDLIQYYLKTNITWDIA